MLLATVAWGEAGYLALWHAGKLFGFLSTFGSGLMIAQIAPTERLGFWNGVNSGLTNACVGVSQLIFARVYDSFNDGACYTHTPHPSAVFLPPRLMIPT